MVARNIIIIVAVASGLLVSGCSSNQPVVKSPGSNELRPAQNGDPNGGDPPARSSATDGPSTPFDSERARDIDQTKGPTATIIYVTEVGDRGSGASGTGKRPAAMIFSSDPDSPYWNEKPGPTRILKPLYREDMGKLLADLKHQGLSSVPSTRQSLTDNIDAGRQIILIEGDSRVTYREPPLAGNATIVRAFRACEAWLIDASYRDSKLSYTSINGQGGLPKPN